MSVLIINCGNFSSLDNFYRSVGLSLQVNEESTNMIFTKIELDCQLLNRVKNIRISVLTCLLSLAYDLKIKYKTTCHIVLAKDPSILQFFKDTNFYLVSKTDEIINWDLYETVDEDILLQVRNINCKIISFSDLMKLKANTSNINVATKTKNYLQDVLPGRILREYTSILMMSEYDERKLVIGLLSKTISEYVINAIIHGKSSSYLGVQLSRAGISVCISDSGIGVLNSLKQNYNAEWANRININSDIDAILNASLKQNIDIGLRDTIHTIIEKEGFTVISSGNAEIIWGQRLWQHALNFFDHINYQNTLQKHENILTYKLNDRNTKEDLINQGGYRIFDYNLQGTRIFFEIPFT
jgi:hypothetical protein